MPPITPRLVDPPSLLATFDGMGGLSGLGSDQALEMAASARSLGGTGLSFSVTSNSGQLIVELPRAAGRLLRRKKAETATVSFSELIAAVGENAEFLVCLDSPDALNEAHSLVTARGMLPRVRIGCESIEDLTEFKASTPGATTVLFEGPNATRKAEALAAQLRERSIDSVAAPHQVWTGGHVAMFHRFGRMCFALGATQPHEIESALSTGIDGLSGPFPDRLLEGFEKVR